MRARGYWLFELLGWGAACLGAAESVLRMATGEVHGLAGAGWFTLAGVAVILMANARRRTLLLSEDVAHVENEGTANR